MSKVLSMKNVSQRFDCCESTNILFPADNSSMYQSMLFSPESSSSSVQIDSAAIIFNLNYDEEYRETGKVHSNEIIKYTVSRKGRLYLGWLCNGAVTLWCCTTFWRFFVVMHCTWETITLFTYTPIIAMVIR